MGVTVDLDNADGFSSHWLPDTQDLVKWLSCAWQASAASDEPVNVSIRLVDRDGSAVLNRQYRARDYPTNVLSFPAQLPKTIIKLMEYTHLGDIVICPGIVEQEAQDQQKQLPAHWAHMAIHGFLHLLDYDHNSSVEAEKMESLEILALEKLGFSNPYLIG